ncbi:uncharacterized protein F4822DRAFT_435441 [Hypoxylon trugodes]|uniref:uncharacterized protein n=1 Tax=Hypoxylon trugodes TaxID=326681 RepID=UPI0021975657|nr:uncharacterized protein F4822DRAFT_435441 [Hypoxylon trugodes]KAI1382573.1 hypothetical protein F4822DRAFT_435441 [Hypoxylon trugodes]
MAPFRFQVLNMFRMPWKGLRVILELPGSPSLLYTAETTEDFIESWYPIISELQDPSPYGELVDIKPNQTYRVTVHIYPWYQCRWPQVSFDTRGESQITTLCVSPYGYNVSVKRVPLPLSAMDCFLHSESMVGDVRDDHMDEMMMMDLSG